MKGRHEGIAEILRQEIGCARQVRRESDRIHRFILRGELDRAAEILRNRNDTIEEMKALDRELSLLCGGTTNRRGREWDEITGLARTLQDLTRAISQADERTKQRLEAKGSEISRKLNALLDGRKAAAGYRQGRGAGRHLCSA